MHFPQMKTDTKTKKDIPFSALLRTQPIVFTKGCHYWNPFLFLTLDFFKCWMIIYMYLYLKGATTNFH